MSELEATYLAATTGFLILLFTLCCWGGAASLVALLARAPCTNALTRTECLSTTDGEWHIYTSHAECVCPNDRVKDHREES